MEKSTIQTYSKTIFQLSEKDFWGFSINIDVSIFEQVEDIIKYIKLELKTFLLSRNLQILSEKVDRLQLHIHEKYEDLNKFKKIYICDHIH